MRMLCFGTLVLFNLAVGCREPPIPPSQQAVDRAWQRTTDAIQQATDADHQVRHARRMRDVDRMRYESDSSDTRSMLAWHRGIVAGQSLMLFAAVIWLAIEIRRRRMLTAIVTNVLENEGGVLRPNDECKRSSPDWG